MARKWAKKHRLRATEEAGWSSDSCVVCVASSPGSPSFHSIIPRVMFDLSNNIHGIIVRKEGENGAMAVV